MRSLLIGLLFSVGLVPAAKAAEAMAGGPTYAGPSQLYAACTLFNSGGSAVSVSAVTIYDSDGAIVAPSFYNCSSSLGARKTCGAVATIGAKTYSCRVAVGTRTNIRATLEIRDSGGALLNSLDLR
jgi:hypothetical protein